MDAELQLENNLDIYKVKKVLNKQRVGRHQEYLVKWLGYNKLENT